MWFLAAFFLLALIAAPLGKQLSRHRDDRHVFQESQTAV
jgi:hypothetical protein